MRAFREWIDRLFWVLKWPTALLSLYLLPGALSSLWRVLAIVSGHQGALAWALGAVAYTLFWLKFFRAPSFGSFLTTLEHELTHGLFALITFHPVVGFAATWRRGGHLRFRGRGNWLIALAPYFFPLFTVLGLVFFWVLGLKQGLLRFSLLGVLQAFFLCGATLSWHRDQQDFAAAGRAFSLLVLPAALATTQSLVIAVAFGAQPIAWLGEVVSEERRNVAPTQSLEVSSRGRQVSKYWLLPESLGSSSTQHPSSPAARRLSSK